MKFRVLVLLSVVFMGISASGVSHAQADIETISRAVVRIVAYVDGDAVGSASGTLVSETGRIFTNAHVTAGVDEFEIAILDDINEFPVPRYYARLIVQYNQIDFSVLQIDRTLDGEEIDPDTLQLPFIPISEEEVSRGDEITIFGYPGIGDGYLVVTSGEITTIQNGRLDGEAVPAVYQTSAEIAPGNSGGLVVNEAGEMIAIPYLVSSESRTGGRLGQLLPIHIATAFLDKPTIKLEFVTAPIAPSAIEGGTDIDCGNGLVIEDGIETIISQMRSGYSYTVSVVGINDFVPVLGVITEFGDITCRDTPATLTDFSFSLPSIGQETQIDNAVQYTFSQNTGRELADMRLIVGGKDGTFGEFLLLLEGLAFTEFDGGGDPIAVILNPRMMNSVTPLTVYMIGIVDALDPYMYIARDGELIYDCDDAGAFFGCALSTSLWGSYVPRANQTRLLADALDAMIEIPFDTFPADAKQFTLPLEFFMASSGYSTYGHYIFALHASSR